MCGRVAQSSRCLASAETLFNQRTTEIIPQGDNECVADENSSFDGNKFSETLSSFHDNFNLSPGMSSIIFHAKTLDPKCTSKDPDGNRTSSQIKSESCQKYITCSEKLWGLCPQSGSVSNPLPPGVSKHFSNLMYNARSDTLYEKRTFRQLALNGNSCIWCIDGFFEWKEPEKNVLSNQTGKQPYFVYRKDGLPLIIPGLFTKVKTGRKVDGTGEDETIETFTLITTSACQSLKWLHHRQPSFIWDINLAIEWLYRPTEELVAQFSKLSSDFIEEESDLVWHPVKKQMSKVSYRDSDSINAIKVEKVASVKSFFINERNKGKDNGIKGSKAFRSAITSGVKRTTSNDQNSKIKYGQERVDQEGGAECGFKRSKIVPDQEKKGEYSITHFFSKGSPQKLSNLSKTNITRKFNPQNVEKKDSIARFFSKQQSKK